MPGAQFAALLWTGAFAPPPPVLTYLILAGGGSGGGSAGGGGGSGGILTGSIPSPAASYAVVVGAGGIGGSGGNFGGNGGNSSLGAFVATGGGAGGPNSGTGHAGGSGGGGGAVGGGGGAGTSGQGFSGGTGSATSPYPTGGGGGPTGNGGAASGSQSGSGGGGGSVSITGSAVIYGGGGGGGGTTQGAAPGVGGGTGGVGTPGGGGTGGQGGYGGGGGGSDNNSTGGTGGQGIVIVSYPGSTQASGGTITSSGGNTIHTFTASGTFAWLAQGPAFNYAANDPLLAYTDCVVPSFVNGYARFQRPLDDTGSGYMFAMPGGRLRFRSNAPTVNVLVRYNGLITRTDARNTLGEIFVNGAFVQNFQSPPPLNTVATATLTINNGSSADRLYEVVLPYADGVEFGGVSVASPYVVTAAAPRTGRLMVCLGDSITQGFWGTETRTTWPYLLAAAKGFRCINMGYGGRTTVPTDGTAIANLNPDLVVVLIGTNDYLGQTPVATYQANLQALLTNIHNINSTVPVYLSGIIYNAQSLTIPLASYQAVAGNAITALGYPQLIGVDRNTLITNTSTQMNADGTHPNDAGHTQMAAGWGAVIT